MKKIEFALESFKNIQELIRFIDQKSAAVLVIAGIVFTAFIESSKNLSVVNVSETNIFGVLAMIFGLGTVVTLTIVIIITIFDVLKPRLAKNYKKNEHSLYYFEHIEQLGKKGLEIEYEELKDDDDKMLKYINDQQFEVARILAKKTKGLSISFNWLFYSIIFLAAFILTSNQI